MNLASVHVVRGAGVRGAAMLALGLLVASAGDREPDSAPCEVHGASVLVYEGSRLLAVTASELALSRGRVLSCPSAEAAAVIAAIERALEDFPAERLRSPVRVHVDPRLPRREAPVNGIEVHATSREILVSGAALADLPPSAWTHELLHVLAPAPPVRSLVGRRSWLTLEEALVSYLTPAFSSEHFNEAEASGGVDPLPGGWEELVLAEYDPHVLARGLQLELTRAASSAGALRASEELLDCLSAAPISHGTEKVRDVIHIFVSRCAPGPERLLESAARRWLPEPFSPWPSAPIAAAAAPETR